MQSGMPCILESGSQQWYRYRDARLVHAHVRLCVLPPQPLTHSSLSPLTRSSCLPAQPSGEILVAPPPGSGSPYAMKLETISEMEVCNGRGGRADERVRRIGEAAHTLDGPGDGQECEQKAPPHPFEHAPHAPPSRWSQASRLSSASRPELAMLCVGCRGSAQKGCGGPLEPWRATSGTTGASRKAAERVRLIGEPSTRSPRFMSGERGRWGGGVGSSGRVSRPKAEAISLGEAWRGSGAGA